MVKLRQLGILLVFVWIGSAHILSLDHVEQALKAECWILDTSNLTKIGMGNCQGLIYYLNVGIGTPPQYFNLQVDTSRGLIWLPLDGQFQSNQSETFEITNQNISTYLNSSLCEGQLGSEIVTIAGTPILTRNSVAWTSQSLNLHDGIQGLVGMGFYEIPNFLDNAASHHQIQSPIFSLEMKPALQQSILYYNSIPDQIIEDTLYVPIVGQSMWQVSLEAIRVNNYDYTYISARSLILDTSVNMIYLNNRLYSRIMSDYFSKCSDKRCPCQYQYPDIVFELDGIELAISSDNYLQERNDGCYLMLGATTYSESPILIGTTLMKGYIVTFDKQNSRLGFNAPPTKVWGFVFLVLQFTMAAFMSGMVAFAGLLYWQVRGCKFTNQCSSQSVISPKTSKSKAKTKAKPKKPTSISMQFLQP